MQSKKWTHSRQHQDNTQQQVFVLQDAYRSTWATTSNAKNGGASLPPWKSTFSEGRRCNYASNGPTGLCAYLPHKFLHIRGNVTRKKENVGSNEVSVLKKLINIHYSDFHTRYERTDWKLQTSPVLRTSGTAGWRERNGQECFISGRCQWLT